ncbi:hypothetical protein HZ326_25398 [Fusarium oxysporum f. sp. albedinis]|nr:hypothetical protein HZ326_25398 [Fusarium oxysporum f. sp. albedinis]
MPGRIRFYIHWSRLLQHGTFRWSCYIIPPSFSSSSSRHYLLSAHKPQSRTPPHMTLVMTTVQAGYGKLVLLNRRSGLTCNQGYFKITTEMVKPLKGQNSTEDKMNIPIWINGPNTRNV